MNETDAPPSWGEAVAWLDTDMVIYSIIGAAPMVRKRKTEALGVDSTEHLRSEAGSQSFFRRSHKVTQIA
jgi:hypothetical protein